MVQLSLAKARMYTLQEVASDGSDCSTPDADTRRLFLGEDGSLHLKDSADVITDVGGGGLSHSTLGTTSLGGSFDTTQKTIMKKVTLAAAGFIAAIRVGVKGQASGSMGLNVGVFSDNSGTPLSVIATNAKTRTILLSTGGLIGEAVLSSTARFIAVPLGLWVPAGDYWIAAIGIASSGNDVQLAYSSGTGSDRTKASTDGFYDHAMSASSTGTHDYSIYADILS